MLSAQTTDVNVNRVTEHLFEKYRRPEDYLAVPQEELERDIYATGFFRQKAKSLRGTMRVLLEEFDGRVPRTIPELLRLPGRRAQDRQRGRRRARQPAGRRRRHARSPAVAAPRPDEAGGPGQDRARPREARPARGLGPVPAPADLARAADLRRAAPALRGVRAQRPLPLGAGLDRAGRRMGGSARRQPEEGDDEAPPGSARRRARPDADGVRARAPIRTRSRRPATRSRARSTTAGSRTSTARPRRGRREPRATRTTAASRRSTSASPAARTTTPSPARTWPTSTARCRA